MAISRYARSPILGFGSQQGTSESIAIIRKAVRDGQVSTTEVTTRGRDRLDTLAGILYGDARYWWILAAASDIGWALQVPPGTVIKVPNLADIAGLVG